MISARSSTSHPWRSVAWRYALAVLAALAAIWLRMLLRHALPEVPFILFFPAVMIAAWLGGLGPGLLATTLCTFATWYFFVPPHNSFDIEHPVDFFKLCLFYVEGVLISVLVDALLRARDRARQDADLLRRSDNQIRLVTDSVPALVSYIDRDHRYVTANQTYREWFGLATEDVRGRHMRDVIGEASYERVRPYLEQAFAGQRVRYETELPYGTGPRFVEASYVPDLAPDGHVRGIVALVNDITQRKRAENADRFLADAGAVLSTSLDYHKTLQRIARLAVPTIADWCGVDMIASDGSLQRLVITHADPAREQLATELWRRYPRRFNEAALADVIATGKATLFDRIPPEMVRRNAIDDEHAGIILSLKLSSAMMVPLVARGRTIGAITLVSAESARVFDTTDLEVAEELAQRAALAIDNARLYAEAQDANRAKDQFLATISHELRTPLNAILGWSQLLAMGGMPQDEQRHGLQTIDRNARAQAQLIEDLLDVSRIITGKLRLDMRPLDLRAVIDAAIDSVRHTADARRVTLRLETTAAIQVSGDAARLQQVVWNLLSNAIKFTPAGGCVDVRAARDDGHALVEVADTGPGVDPDFLPHVFDRFRQQDSTTTRKHGGLGIGLSIVRQLVELHGGTVGARNQADSGAVFTVRLPLASQASGDDGLTGGSRPLIQDGEQDLLTGLRVLVVDDEPDTLDLITRVLRRCRADVTAVSSARAALEAIRTRAPDVLLSDIAMPEMDGYALIREMRQMESARHVPAAALTAFARAEDHRRAIDEGFQLHLPKPVEPAQLAAVVADLARRAIRT